LSAEIFRGCAQVFCAALVSWIGLLRPAQELQSEHKEFMKIAERKHKFLIKPAWEELPGDRQAPEILTAPGPLAGFRAKKLQREL
jgi:hypothetical protein